MERSSAIIVLSGADSKDGENVFRCVILTMEDFTSIFEYENYIFFTFLYESAELCYLSCCN